MIVQSPSEGLNSVTKGISLRRAQAILNVLIVL
jgi:hypothetical protein